MHPGRFLRECRCPLRSASPLRQGPSGARSCRIAVPRHRRRRAERFGNNDGRGACSTVLLVEPRTCGENRRRLHNLGNVGCKPPKDPRSLCRCLAQFQTSWSLKWHLRETANNASQQGMHPSIGKLQLERPISHWHMHKTAHPLLSPVGAQPRPRQRVLPKTASIAQLQKSRCKRQLDFVWPMCNNENNHMTRDFQVPPHGSTKRTGRCPTEHQITLNLLVW
mmetsp:Transcript_5881/g.14313  ORF Transcript_5881/g.14313 Transcript_5881/m.14313 type:complete len:222 (-) Transcript_5881:159-824(-)